MPGYATEPTAPVGLNTILRGLIRQPPLTVAPSAPIREMLQAMNEGGGDVAIVVDPDSRVPLGMVTLREVLGLIAQQDCDISQPVVGVMTGGLPSLPAEATVQQATVLMVRRGLRHLVLTEPDGSLFGVIAQGEIYGLQAAGSEPVVSALLAARDIDELALASIAVRRFAERRLAEGVGAEALCQWISALNDLITVQAIDLVEAQFELPYVPWCWLVFGSEGRLEQTLVTDQDNGIVFAAASRGEAEGLRAAFQPFAEAVNRALDACGFPWCKGNIMASNPAWCLSLDEWRRIFDRWISAVQPAALLNASIFFDFRPLFGRDDLADGLRHWLLARIAASPPFLRAMTASALATAPPLGRLGGFKLSRDAQHPHTLDLKAQGIRHFVDAARILALGSGIAHTNTVERLRAAGRAHATPLEETSAATDAFYQIQRLRLRSQISGEFPLAANRLSPSRLHELDRHILKEALRHAQRLQQRIGMNFGI